MSNMNRINRILCPRLVFKSPVLSFALLSGYLLSHLYPTYTEEVQRHECHQCGRSYKWRSSLKSHLQNECGKEPRFLCPHCPYRCKVRSNLFKHLRNYHKTYIAPLKKEWRRQQPGGGPPDMLSMMSAPQPQPYNLSKAEKIESSPLISSYATGGVPYNLTTRVEKIETSPLISSYSTSPYSNASTSPNNTLTSAGASTGYGVQQYGGPISPPASIPGSPSTPKTVASEASSPSPPPAYSHQTTSPKSI
ncbi:hypothetical protein WDU94_006361 [Cyamophila willieti]